MPALHPEGRDSLLRVGECATPVRLRSAPQDHPVSACQLPQIMPSLAYPLALSRITSSTFDPSVTVAPATGDCEAMMWYGVMLMDETSEPVNPTAESALYASVLVMPMTFGTTAMSDSYS